MSLPECSTRRSRAARRWSPGNVKVTVRFTQRGLLGYDGSSLMFRFETAGESHGECLVATLTGLPAGIPVSLEAVDRELWRRQQGYGRGGRMKIETDRARVVSGVRHSRTIGSPIAILLENKDWKNWTEALPVEDIDGAERKEDKKKPVTRPRPGHADLAGAIKYNFH